MCGIAGWVDFRDDLYEQDAIMEKVSATLAQRGPDAKGEWKSHEAYIVHRRLIVVDPENGKQPMVKTQDSADYVLTYNGELYNTEDIRKELLALGHTFAGHSDTEVLLTAYMQWGADCLERLNGIYAFGIWNTREKTLFLARDRVGVKPLFYYPYDGGVVFGSEIRTLLAHPYVRPRLDAHGLAGVMLLGPGRTPGDGVFKGIRELRPACCAKLSRDGMITREYWRIKAAAHTEDLSETAEHVRGLVVDSIERQLVSDVPLCTFLSGGLDSSVISKVTADLYAQKGMALHTYSVDYKDNRKNFKASAFQPDEDAPWIVKMSEYIASKHHDVVIDTPQLIQALCPAAEARSLPGMADVDSSLLLFCKEVKRNFVVAVSGECADEVFGGYPWYHNPEILYRESFPWSQSTDLRAGLLRRGALGGIDPEEYVRERYRETVDNTEKLDADSPLNARMREMFMLNVKWFMQTLLDAKGNNC